jgi:hypothetical protein
LGFPNSESVRKSLGIPVLEPKNSIFREMRVVDLEFPGISIWDNVGQRSVMEIFILMEHNGMSMRESSSLDVLT